MKTYNVSPWFHKFKIQCSSMNIIAIDICIIQHAYAIFVCLCVMMMWSTSVIFSLQLYHNIIMFSIDMSKSWVLLNLVSLATRFLKMYVRVCHVLSWKRVLPQSSVFWYAVIFVIVGLLVFITKMGFPILRLRKFSRKFHMSYVQGDRTGHKLTVEFRKCHFCSG